VKQFESPAADREARREAAGGRPEGSGGREGAGGGGEDEGDELAVEAVDRRPRPQPPVQPHREGQPSPAASESANQSAFRRLAYHETAWYRDVLRLPSVRANGLGIALLARNCDRSKTFLRSWHLLFPSHFIRHSITPIRA
jgi:hypothetical protein